MKKFFVSDLDWTLLSGSILSKYTRDKIFQILKHNEVLFTIASARSLATIKELMDPISFHLPIIQLNGACITDYKTNINYHTTTMEEKHITHLFVLLNELLASYLVTGIKNNQPICFFPLKKNKLMNEFYLERIKKKDPRIKEVIDMKEAIDCEVLSITLIEPKHQSENICNVIKKELKKSIQIYPMGIDSRGWEWTTFQAIKATKGNAITKICEDFGYSINTTTSFGDNINDISMIIQSGTGIAVENAIDSLKHHAQKIIGPCQSNSVINYILDNY